MGGIIPGQVVLRCIKKQTESAMESWPVSSASLRSRIQFLLPDSCCALVPALTSLSDELRSVGKCKPSKRFSPKSLSVLIIARANKLEHTAFTPCWNSFPIGQAQGRRDGSLNALLEMSVRVILPTHPKFLTHEFWQPVRSYVHFTSDLKHVSQPLCSCYPFN